MQTGTVLALFVDGIFAAIILAFIIANKHWEKMGYHQELNEKKPVIEKWKLKGGRKKQ